MEYQLRDRCMNSTELLKKLKSGSVSLVYTDELSGKRRDISATLKKEMYEDLQSKTGQKSSSHNHDIKRQLIVWSLTDEGWISIQLRLVVAVNDSAINGVTID